MYFGGVEGGTTCSKVVILNENGKEVGCSEGPDTNGWIIGIEEVCRRINSMVENAKKNAGVPSDKKLKVLGMCLSGGEQESQNKKLIGCFQRSYPELAENFVIKTDTFGSIATACPNGGLVLISGTGSNCQLVNADGSTARCGGWGHMLGDEGSAYWISHRAIKRVFDHEDNMCQSDLDVSFVKEAMYKYFEIKDRYDLLDHIYTDFKKPKFAGFCKILAVEGALQVKDPLCLQMFRDAGEVLAQHVLALVPFVHEALLSQEDGLQVVCVGSVFKSWSLLKDSFCAKLRAANSKLKSLVLVELSVVSAVGAALIGAQSTGQKLPIDLSKNFTVLEKIKL